MLAPHWPHKVKIASRWLIPSPMHDLDMLATCQDTFWRAELSKIVPIHVQNFMHKEGKLKNHNIYIYIWAIWSTVLTNTVISGHSASQHCVLNHFCILLCFYQHLKVTLHGLSNSFLQGMRGWKSASPTPPTQGRSQDFTLGGAGVSTNFILFYLFIIIFFYENPK